MRGAWIALALAACAETSTVVCESGRICPAGFSCDDVHDTCIPPGCGDNAVSGGEDCDGTIADVDCTDLGYYVREGLACSSTCTFDTTSCVGICGDHVANGPERCDGIPPGQVCADFGFDIGRLECSAGCTPGFASCGYIGW